jgi:peptidoglycan hydrolase-like protein with peptidoglycan-binding domain
MLAATVLLAGYITGCSERPLESGTELPSPSTVARDLTVGSQGDDVRAVTNYLTAFGYFPNDKLARQYPAWRPLTPQSPQFPAVFDENTASAIRQLQANTGIPVSGVVDEATRAVLYMPRCGVPDGIQPVDQSDKFSLIAGGSGNFGGRVNITWSLTNANLPPNLTFNQIVGAIQTVANAWSSTTNLSIARTSGSGDIRIQFAFIDGPNQILGETSGTSITLDSAESWTISTPTPGASLDLNTVAEHEMGHALGLDHTGVSNAVMFPVIPSGVERRTPVVDDSVAVSTMYDTWAALPGAAKDVAIGADGSLWVIGTNPVGTAADFGIYKFNGSGWDAADGGAVRIAVDPSGAPWIVNSQGVIFQRTSNSPFSGSWTQQPGLAKDIGIGFDGSVWVIGTNPIGFNFGIYKWNGSNWDGSDGSAVRIAVGPEGFPWIVNSQGQIFRRTTSSPSSGTWTQLSGNVFPFVDVGIGPGNFGWAVANTNGEAILEVRDEQQSSPGVPARNTWIQTGHRFGTGNSAVSVTVDPNGQPVMLRADGTILRATK